MATKKSTKPMYIGIDRLWYLDSIDEALNVTKIAEYILSNDTTEINNSHQDTFQYEHEDGEQEEYINELTGEIYYVDPTTQGKRTITFTSGQYDYADKAALQGGEVIYDTDGTTAIGWSAPETLKVIKKAFIAKCKTGNYVIFTNANVVGKTTMASKNMGLGITATAMSSEYEGVKSEYWFTGAKVDAAIADAKA